METIPEIKKDKNGMCYMMPVLKIQSPHSFKKHLQATTSHSMC